MGTTNRKIHSRLILASSSSDIVYIQLCNNFTEQRESIEQCGFFALISWKNHRGQCLDIRIQFNVDVKTYSQTYWSHRVIKFILFLFWFLVFFLFWEKVSLCISDWSKTHYVEEVGPKLTEIGLPLPPEIWDKWSMPSHQFGASCFIVKCRTFKMLCQHTFPACWPCSKLASTEHIQLLTEDQSLSLLMKTPF